MHKTRFLFLPSLSFSQNQVLTGVLLLLTGIASVACSNPPSGNPIATTPVATATLPTNVTPETKNPLSDLGAAARTGKPLYQANCAFCHGDTGAGDGPAGPSFDPKPTDLVQGRVTTDPDGKLFLVLKNGVGKMPAMKKLTDEELWQVVAYTRTLANK